MKKLLAFMMALAFSFMFFGTYGFEDAVCTEDHLGHVHAADDVVDDDVIDDDEPTDEEDAYIFITVDDAEYNATKKTLTVDFSIDCTESMKITSAELIISTNGRVLGTPTIKSGRVFGQSARDCAEAEKLNSYVTAITITLDYNKNNSESPSGYLTVEYPVNSTIIREQTLTFEGFAVAVDGSNIAYDPLSTTEYVYVCEHGETDTFVSKKATCKTAGEERVYCVECECVLETKTVPSTDHDFDFENPTNTKLFPYTAPTCTTRGYGFFTCKDCGATDTSYVPATGHTLGERYLEGTRYYQDCTECGMAVRSSNQCAHDLEDYVQIETKTVSTCTKAGVGVFECPICEQTEERALELADHKVSSWTTSKAATCTKAGTKYGTCTVCKKTVNTPIEMTGHDYGDWKVTTKATCTEDGVETRTCDNCNAKETRAIDMIGHDYGSWETEKDPTCEAVGRKVKHCSNCGDTEYATIALTGHTYGDYVTTKLPTCTTPGEKVRTCSVCGDEDAASISIDLTAHQYGEAVTVTDKTCTEDGLKQQTCVYCGDVKDIVDACEGHTFVESKDGDITTLTCSVCGYKEITEAVKGGVEKTLEDNGSKLVLAGSSASSNVAFEIDAMNMEDLAYYKQYYNTLENGYVYSVEIDGKDATMSADMSLVLNVEAFDGYECKVYKLLGNALYPITDCERDDNEITISGANLAGVDTIFVERGEEIKPNYIIPIVITVATIAVAAVVIILLTKKSKNKESF